MFKSYKYRLYPSESQKVLLAKHFGSNRLIWNYFLSKHNEEHKSNPGKKEFNTYCRKADHLKAMKCDTEFTFLREINSQSLQQTLMHLDTAFKNFFRDPVQFGYPNYKSKKKKQSFTIPQHIEIDCESGVTSLCKLGNISTIFHRKLEGEIKSCVISKTPSNNYYIAILCEISKSLPQLKPVTKETILGLDMGIKDFAVMSNRIKVANPKFLKAQTKRLKHFQRIFSKKKKYSTNREKQRVKVSKLHERIDNQRSNFLHKLSRYIINDNQVNAIVVEGLAVNNMVKNHNLARAILDSSWSEFIRQLEYKSSWCGKTFLKADRFFPSSKMCNNCGYINHDLELKDRIWICPNCGSELDRDLNASYNLRQLGVERLVPRASWEQIKLSPAEPLASTSNSFLEANQSCEVGNRGLWLNGSTCPAS